MNLQIKNNQKGFTIVELLIVIVVIAILAAITIVAFNGIQGRAKTSSAQSAAASLDKKIEAYNAINSQYPNTANVITCQGTSGACGTQMQHLQTLTCYGTSLAEQLGHVFTTGTTLRAR